MVGVRTEIAYATVDRWAVVAPTCSACASPIPANEWTWLEVKNFPRDEPLAWVRVAFSNAEGVTRVLAFLAAADLPPLLTPAARDGETLIHVTITNGPMHRLEATFVVGDPLPPDPREIRLDPPDGWTRYTIDAAVADRRAYFLFAPAWSSAEAQPTGWILDHRVVYADGGEWWRAGFDLGSRTATPTAVVSTAPPTAEFIIRPGVADGRTRHLASMTHLYEPPMRSELVFGQVGSGEDRAELLLFSMANSFEVRKTGAGPLWTVAGTTDGVRIHTSGPSAQAWARVEARANFGEASFVVAQAEGGSLGSGTARISHGPRSTSEHIANIGSPKRILSHGDCSGEWSASLDGTTATVGEAPFDAALMAAKAYTPSIAFQTLWNTRNGWCA